MTELTLDFRINDDTLPDRIRNRILVVLDTSVWFDLEASTAPQIQRVKGKLRDLVEQGKIFCPLSYPASRELFKRNFNNAWVAADLMEELSLNITFERPDIVHDYEEITFINSACYAEKINVDRTKFLAPFGAWIGGDLSVRLDFPDAEIGGSERQKIAHIIESGFPKTIKEYLRLLKHELPLPEPIKIPGYGWKERWKKNKGNKSLIRLKEQEFILEKISKNLIEKIDSICLEEQDPISSSINMKRKLVAYLNSLPKDKANSNATAILDHFPAYKNMIEVLAFTSLDPNRKESINDFYDIQFMVVALSYSDIAVATDRWIRHLIEKNKDLLHINSARFIGTWTEFEYYLGTL